MALWLHRPREPRCCFCLAAILWLLATAPFLRAQMPPSIPFSASRATPSSTLEERVRQLEDQNSAIVEQNRRLAAEIDSLSVGEVCPASGEDPADQAPATHGATGPDAAVGTPWYSAGYDHGFVISPADPDAYPFEMMFNNQNQFRYTGFARGVRTWTDSAGVVSPVSNRSSFELPRGRAIFSGFAFQRELTYNLNLDYNTVSDSQINFRAYWLAYHFGPGLTVFLGQSKVPGTREWLTSSMFTLGPDRSLATTFFRPSLSQGIWATGQPVDGLFYHVMMANGFNTLGTTPQKLNSRMAFSGSLWAEPWGEFGPGYSDFEWHDEPAIRLGTSLTYSPEQGPQGNPDFPENSDIRFSDGTLITATGALAPGVTLNVYYIGLAAFDFAFKHRGFSLSSELYLQDLFNLRGNGPLPHSSVFEYGGFAQIGCYVIPQKFELYARTSQITGPFGTGSEYAGGLNWFFLPGKQNLRFTLDAAWLNHSPAQQNRTDYQAGQTGWLFRSQIQTFF